MDFIEFIKNSLSLKMMLQLLDYLLCCLPLSHAAYED